MNFEGEKHLSLKSTQATLKELLLRGPLPSFYFVMAEEQSEGRGRSDHQWSSISGNLHVSILLNEIPFSGITWVPLWIATSLHDVIVGLGANGNKIRLKWPNDFWIDGDLKVGGIICEKIDQRIVVGIGLNLVHAPLLNSGVVPSAHSLSIDLLIKTLIQKLSEPVSISLIKDYYLRHAFFQNGMKVTWKNEMSNVVLVGEVEGLGEFGELRVLNDENVISLYSEEVSLVRVVGGRSTNNDKSIEVTE